MPKPVVSSPKSDGKDASTRWSDFLQGLDSSVGSLLRADPVAVQRNVWDALGVEPSDGDETSPATPYWCVLIEANTLSCSIRGFGTEAELIKMLTKLRSGQDEYIVVPFVGRPIPIGFDENRMTVVSFDGKKAYVADEDNALSCVDADKVLPIEPNNMLVPINALSALPQLPHPVPASERKRRKNQ